MESVVFGSDGENTVGVIQCLGHAGINVLPYVFNGNNGIVQSSKYCKKVYFGNTIEQCVNQLVTDGKTHNYKIPIIATSDLSAYQIEIHKNELNKYYLFEHTTKDYSICDLLNKKLQLKLANQCGFNVPIFYTDSDNPNYGFKFPCIIKPLISKEGSKSDLRICNNSQEYQTNIKTLTDTEQFIVEQYIERDYEISIIGCSLKNGECIVPAIEYKLSLFPMYTGLECLAKIDMFNEIELKECVCKFIQETGYIGLFSIEIMHNKIDGKYYFTEINLRNDGANSFVFKYGVNLPLTHIMDLLNIHYDWDENKKRPGYYIWDIHHFKSLLHKDISTRQWIFEIFKSKGFLMFDIHDPKPFFKLYASWFKRKI